MMNMKSISDSIFGCLYWNVAFSAYILQNYITDWFPQNGLFSHTSFFIACILIWNSTPFVFISHTVLLCWIFPLFRFFFLSFVSELRLFVNESARLRSGWPRLDSWEGHSFSLCFPAHNSCGALSSLSSVGTRSCLTWIKAFVVWRWPSFCKVQIAWSFTSTTLTCLCAMKPKHREQFVIC